MVCSFENGGLLTTNQIFWKPTNLLLAEDLKIRAGDSLLLDVIPTNATDGATAIQIVGVTNYTSSAGTPIVHTFNSAGLYKIVGTHTSARAGAQQRSIAVEVLDVPSALAVGAWVGKWRSWLCPAPKEIVLETDPCLTVQLDRNQEQPGSHYKLVNTAPDNHYIVARVQTNGPILAHFEIEGFRFWSGNETGLKRIHTYEDGSELIEMELIVSPLPSQINVRVSVEVGGVLFEDGTLLQELSRSDFDALGRISVRFIRPLTAKTSVCHRTAAYEGRVLLGVYP